MTFRVGGGGGPATYVALCRGRLAPRCKRRCGVGQPVDAERPCWDLAPYVGKRMFIKIVDESEAFTIRLGPYHRSDNFQFDSQMRIQP